MNYPVAKMMETETGSWFYLDIRVYSKKHRKNRDMLS
jgi:hypothetical protein